MKTIILSLVLAFCVSAQQPPLRVVTCADAGANDTYTCTASPTLGAYVAGQVVLFTANTANTGAATVNIDSLGSKTIVKLGGGITTALADNDIRANQRVMLQYDGTNFQMLSQLGNAASGGGGSTVLPGYGQATAPASGVTWYFSFSPMGSPSNTSDDAQQVPVRAGTLQNLRIYTSTSQGAADNVCTVWVVPAADAYGANGSASSVVTTITASGGAGLYSSTGTGTTNAGDRIYLKCVNGAVTGAAIRAFSVELQ